MQPSLLLVYTLSREVILSEADAASEYSYLSAYFVILADIYREDMAKASIHRML